MLNELSGEIGRQINCAMVYNDSAPDWSTWENPWFIGQSYDDNNLGAWAAAPGTNRRLIITQNLFPASENSANWLQQGASGAYEGYARTLAANLVRAGLGNAVIRLAHEANGNWYPDSIPGTATGDAEWVQFWRNTVLAMRSVPGANFLFDWCVNAGYRNIPLSSFYPGNDVVDIIGVDAYDNGVKTTGAARWSSVYNLPDGLAAVQAFASAHGKPMSIPEWGLGPAQDAGKTFAGDDPAYVQGIASVVQRSNVAYQSYFDYEEEGVQLANSPASLAAFRSAFGSEGYATAAAATIPLPSMAPSVAVVGGPADGSIIKAGTPVTFTFQAAAGAVAQCNSTGSWRSCSGASSDTLTGLAPGFYLWRLRVFDALHHYTRLLGRAFLVTS